MRRDQLILELSRRLGIPKHSAQVFLHSFFDSAKAALRTGDPLRLGSIGTWTPKIHADGTLQSVTYAPAAEALVEESVLPAGPHSSIDSIHFIPAEALDPDASIPAAALIDVEELVEEVQSQFRSANGSGNGEDPAAPLPEPPHDAMIAPGPGTFPDDELLEDVEHVAYQEEHVADDDAALVDEYASLQEDSAVDEALTAFPDDMYVDDIVLDDELTEEIGTRDQEVEDVESDDPHDADDMDEVDGMADVEDEDESDDEEEDNEVFYKNRDQLYNPPEERSSRPLMMIALVLTVVVVTILLFILFGEEKRPAVPGHSTGQGLYLGSPTPAGAPFPYFE